jgi:hypothetical protein
MVWLLALLTVNAALITVSAADAQCPSVRQVNEAVAARLPGVLVPSTPTPPAGVLELRLAGNPASGHRLALTDGRGQVLLSRELPPSTATRDRDCEALAETVALIVDRYLQELAYQSPPTVTAVAAAPSVEEPGTGERRWELFTGGTWQPSNEAGAAAGYEARLGVGRTLGRAARYALELTVGVQQRKFREAADPLWRFPAELRLLWRQTPRPVRLEVGPFAGAQVLLLGNNRDPMAAGAVRIAPVAGGLGSVRFALGNRGFIRLVGAAGVALVRYSFQPPPYEREVFGTERAYVKMGAEGGLAFW